MRVFLIVCLLIASQPLLICLGMLMKWAIECRDGACAGTAYAASPFGSPRDLLLTAIAAAAPYLLAVLIAALTWLLTSMAARLATARRRSAAGSGGFDAVPEIHMPTTHF